MTYSQFTDFATDVFLKWCEHHPGMENIDDETMLKLIQTSMKFAKMLHEERAAEGNRFEPKVAP
jgi:hypothetical protein